MHQGNGRDLPDDTQVNIRPSRWDTSTRLGPLRQNSEGQESQSSFGRGQRMKKPSSKGREYTLSQIKDKKQDYILEF